MDELINLLRPRYGQGEAASIARIVMQDEFGGKTRPDSSERARFEAVAARLLTGEPVQYVLGRADFFGLKFQVSPAVLIPRQETEELVAWVLEDIKNHPAPHPIVLDVGVGSGCIGLTLKKKRPAVQLYGMEKSAAALEIAVQNSINLGLQAVNLRLLDALSAGDWQGLPDFDYIVSNPPYIGLSEMNLVPEHVRLHEPGMALFVPNEDALFFYRAITAQAVKKLKPGGRLFFECNQYTATEVIQILEQFEFKNTELRRDIAGANRMARGEI